MSPIRMAIEHTLTSHAPFPAIAIDRLWTIVKANGPAKGLFSLFDVNEGDSLLDGFSRGSSPELSESTVNASHTLSAADFLVVQLDYNASEVTFYVNPDPGAADPAASAEWTATVASTPANMDFDGIRLFRKNHDGRYGWMDELRLGETWSDVSPVAP